MLKLKYFPFIHMRWYFISFQYVQLKRYVELHDLMNAIGITGFGGPVGKNCFAFCATSRLFVVIFHFISLRGACYIYSFSDNSREILKRSRTMTFREMRSGSSREDWLSTMKLHKHSCILSERRNKELRIFCLRIFSLGNCQATILCHYRS